MPRNFARGVAPPPNSYEWAGVAAPPGSPAERKAVLVQESLSITVQPAKRRWPWFLGGAACGWLFAKWRGRG